LALDHTSIDVTPRRSLRFLERTQPPESNVLFSIERTLQVPNGQLRPFTQRIVAQETPDPYTLRLKTAVPYAMVPYDLNSVFIVSKQAAAGARPEDFDSGKAMVGTGPFRLVRFSRGDRVELARNDKYWGAPPPCDKVP